MLKIKSIPVKNYIKSSLRRFGYELHHTESETDPFYVQQALIKGSKPVIFDIGAHVGAVTGIYRKMFPDSTIHCFEPFPESFAKLKKNTEKDPLTFCHNFAVSDKNGTAIFHSNSESTANSLLASDKMGGAFWGDNVVDAKEQIEVKTISLDDFCQEQKIKEIDILKIDIQGSEYEVLQGAKDLLSVKRIKLIYTELIFCPTYEGQHALHEYLSLLAGFGYDFLDIYNQTRRHSQLIQADVVFVPAELKSSLIPQ